MIPAQISVPVNIDNTQIGLLDAWTFEDPPPKGVKATFTSTYPAPGEAAWPIDQVVRELIGAHHANWYQLAIEDNDPWYDACGHKMQAPYVDPPPGGYPPASQDGSDGVWSDSVPWYLDEYKSPEIYDQRDNPYLWWQFLTDGGRVLHFQDDPILSGGMACRFKTWLVAVHATSRQPVTWLPGFEWMSAYPLCGPWSVRIIGAFTNPPPDAEYNDLVNKEPYARTWFWLK